MILVHPYYLFGMNHNPEPTVTMRDLGKILWKEGFLCRYEDIDNDDLVERRWKLRMESIQRTARDVKAMKRSQEHDEDEE